MAEVIIDLGECGEILVESSDRGSSSTADNATEKTGLINSVRQTGGRLKVEAAKLLKLPLTGLAKLFLASLPEPSASDIYELEQFSVEFNLGIKSEAGTNAGAVAKIMPEGAFKCTYTWKRKPMLPAPQSNTPIP
jgi:hypothetical protein